MNSLQGMRTWTGVSGASTPQTPPHPVHKFCSSKELRQGGTLLRPRFIVGLHFRDLVSPLDFTESISNGRRVRSKAKFCSSAQHRRGTFCNQGFVIGSCSRPGFRNLESPVGHAESVGESGRVKQQATGPEAVCLVRVDWRWRGVMRKIPHASYWAKHVPHCISPAAGGTLTGNSEKGFSSGRGTPSGAGYQEEQAENEEDDDFEDYDSDAYEDADDDEIQGFLEDEEIGLDVDENDHDFEDGRGPPHDGDNGSTATIRESTSTLVAQLCARVQAGDGFTVTTADIAALYEFPMDKFQRLAIEGFLKGSSVVVCAPTSSGKTLIAEGAAAATLARQKRLFYTTPLKALSNQKLREFRKLFGESNVGLLTGDAVVNREAPIMVMTTEILRNMLYQSPGSSDEGSRLENVTSIVLDEVHYLSDISRGTVWEETVIYCPKGVQMICLSATIANPEDLAGWIAQVHGPTELVTGTRRPVPLKWHFSTRYDLLPLLNTQGTEMNWKLSLTNSSQRASSESSDDEREFEGRGRKRSQTRKRLNSGNSSRLNDSRPGRWRGNHSNGWEEPEERLSEEEAQFIRRRQVPQVRDTLAQLLVRDMIPAIWFIFSRRGCDTAVRYLQDTNLLSPEESTAVKEEISNFQKDHPDSVRESAVEPLSRGIAAHHAGCLPTWKAFVEELFQRGLVKVVFATETLAAGINMPARTTVLSTLSKRGDAGHALLSANSMLQMAGRAGRRGIDELGHVVVLQTPFEGAEECCKILFAGVDPLVSQFTATYGMALNLLAGGKVSKSSNPIVGDLPAVPFGRTMDDARELIEQSFGNYVGSEVMHAARKQVAKLEDEVERLVQQTQAESSSRVLEKRLTNAELKEYLDLKELVKDQKGVYQKMVSDMEAAQAEAYNDTSLHSGDPFPEVLAAETLIAQKKKEISTLRKSLKRTQGFKENHQLVVLQKSRLEKIARLQNKAARITNRIKQMAPSGWKEFLQVVEVLNAVGAVNMETSELLPLGQTASAVRGENELWLALVFSNESVLSLTAAQLAAVCGSLVSEGLKTRSEDGNSLLYEASRPVHDWLAAMENISDWLLQLQIEHGVNIPCQIDIQFAGMVEAWAAGVTWKELMCDSGMDEGDMARVLRRSIDLLAQIPHMPHIHPDVAKLATQTKKVMDRPPISELLG